MQDSWLGWCDYSGETVVLDGKEYWLCQVCKRPLRKVNERHPKAGCLGQNGYDTAKKHGKPVAAKRIIRSKDGKNWKPRGPGAHLMILIRGIGIRGKGACGCKEMALRMDTWGIEGCEARIDEIAGILREKGKQYGWGEYFAAGWEALKQWKFYNPLDPYPGLVKEAIKLAKADQEKAGKEMKNG